VNLRVAFLSIVLLLLCAETRADDVGVVEVRLIEDEKNSYALEVDVSPYLLNTIGRPILPDRCTYIGDPERVPVGPMLVVRYRFNSGHLPLQPEDELLLYWQRSGIVLTAYWLDGASCRVFFDRGLAGIRVQVSRLREVEITRNLLLHHGFKNAAAHLDLMWLLHVLLVVACAALGSGGRLAALLLAFAAGHGLSLVATDMGVAAIFPTGIVTFLMGLAALLMFIPVALGRGKEHRFWPVLLALGLFHGLGYAGPDFEQQTVLSSVQLVIARFAFNSTIDIMHAFTGIIVWLLILMGTKFNLARQFQQAAVYISGGLALAVIFIYVPDAFAPLSQGRKNKVTSWVASSTAGSTARSPSRPVEINDPIMGFMTVTPFEIRCEWLIRVRDLNPLTQISDPREEVLPIASQAALKEELISRFAAEAIVSVDGQPLQPSEIRADFVTVTSYGVSTRPVPVEEPIDQAAIGLSLAYVVKSAPSLVSLSLLPYPESIPMIPVVFTDPWGSTPHTLTRDNPRAEWKRRMAGFRRPVIRGVNIEPLTWPVLSLIMLIFATGVFIFMRRRWRARMVKIVLLICFVVALFAYPFVRNAVPSSLAERVPAEEKMSRALQQLLTNIYHAFDYRTEEAIYDRLAISATGDQLASIYLQHRSAMEIENRGGARASVDNVEILEISEINPTEDGLSVHAGWMISGSVNHFGHIHYRKNRYQSIVHITARDGVWKISGVDVVEEERIL
jgi:hypothetical protein